MHDCAALRCDALWRDQGYGEGSLLFDDVYCDQDLQLSRDISDVMEGSDIRVLYGMVHIPPGTHRIFTANRDPLFPDPSIQERRAMYVQL